MGSRHGGAIHLLPAAAGFRGNNANARSDTIRFVGIGLAGEMLTAAEDCGVQLLVDGANAEGIRIVSRGTTGVGAFIADGENRKDITVDEDCNQAQKDRSVAGITQRKTDDANAKADQPVETAEDARGGVATLDNQTGTDRGTWSDTNGLSTYRYATDGAGSVSAVHCRVMRGRRRQFSAQGIPFGKVGDARF